MKKPLEDKPKEEILVSGYATSEPYEEETNAGNYLVSSGLLISKDKEESQKKSCDCYDVHENLNLTPDTCGCECHKEKKSWGEEEPSEKAKSFAKHIGIISEGALQTLIDEVKADQKKEIEKLKTDKDNHICRFNDGEQTCDCFFEAIDKVLEILK